ncbi:MAG TPA: hypothetical protein VGM88_20360 [Kofleriaceae bacterium]|jgi:hypothetical protein
MQKLGGSVVLLATGAAFGIGVTLSCSSSPGTADAATCDCPAAEAPIAGRLVSVTSDVVVAAGSDGDLSASCPDGSMTLSGGCSPTDPNIRPRNLILSQSGVPETAPALAPGWVCTFHNSGSASISVRATAYCLKPAN